MATEQPNGADQICTPCRGTGHLISGLGGEPHQVLCPWCRATGHRIPGLDAQEHPAEAGAPADGGGTGAPADGGTAP